MNVLFRVGGTDKNPILRSAVVTVDHGGSVNLLVFLDGHNDIDREGSKNVFSRLPCEVKRQGWIVHCTSVSRGDAAGQCRPVPAPAPTSKNESGGAA